MIFLGALFFSFLPQSYLLGQLFSTIVFLSPISSSILSRFMVVLAYNSEYTWGEFRSGKLFGGGFSKVRSVAKRLFMQQRVPFLFFSFLFFLVIF